MTASIDKLRWGLLGGALLLLLILAASVGFGRYKARQLWNERLKHLGVHIERQSDGITYSQSSQGRTIFTLHAAKAIQHSEGKVTLHDVVITLFGKDQNRIDRIYGNEFEYDDKAGLARAVGEVEMDIRAPGTLPKDKGAAKGPPQADGQSSSERNIHVLTSGLVYMRKLGVAATDQQVDFQYAGLECTSKGAEFDSGESLVHLLSDVQLHGNLRGRPVQLHASKADLNRTENTIALLDPRVESGAQLAQATRALIHLRSDGSIEAAQADGSVVLAKGTRRITAAHAQGSFNSSSLPEQAKLTGGVAMDDADAVRAIHGTAAEVDSTFDASGSPLDVIAIGGAQMKGSARDAAGVMLSRTLRGDRIDAAFKPVAGKHASELTQVHASGSVLGTAAAAAAPTGTKTTQIAADDLRAAFASGNQRNPDLQQVTGMGHTRLQQDAPLGEQQISTGDKLEILFAPATLGSAMQVANAAQTGHVHIQSRAAMRPGSAKPPDAVLASADRSAYDGAAEKLTLNGGAQFAQGGISISAGSMVIDQRTGDSDALHAVTATYSNPQGKGAQAPHILAEGAHLQHDSQVAVFRGTDVQPAKMWQGPSQVEAATLTLDGKRHTLSARPERQTGVVRAVFAGETMAKSPNTAAGAGQSSASHTATRVAASTMDYDDATRTAAFSGSVRVDGSTGQVQAQHAVAFLTPAANGTQRSSKDAGVSSQTSPFGGSLQRVIVLDDVRLSQPGRSGRGDRLVYTAADSSFLLTGSSGRPPQIVDAQQGKITGAALLFRTGDSTIVVSGPSAGPGGGDHGRVRTETGAKE